MNPHEIVDVLRDMRENMSHVTPWVYRPSSCYIALRKDRREKQDWFPVSPALYEAVEELHTKLDDDCFSAIENFEGACFDHEIEGGR